MSTQEILKKVPLFSGLSDPELKILEKAIAENEKVLLVEIIDEIKRLHIDILYFNNVRNKLCSELESYLI